MLPGSLASHTFNVLKNMSDNERADFPLYPDPTHGFTPTSNNPNDPHHSHNMHNSTYPYQTQTTQECFPISTGFQTATMYATDAPQYLESPDLRGAPSNYSTASGRSATSSAMGSPHSIHGHAPEPNWAASQGGLGLTPSIVGVTGFEAYSTGNEYTFPAPEDYDLTFPGKPNGFVDPSILHPAAQYITHPTSTTQSHDAYPGSPAMSQLSRSPQQSPYVYSYSAPHQPSTGGSRQSCSSQDGSYSGEDAKDKGRCSYPECGKVFKDLKAHMLTHQNERPEKCPIQNCDYHVKGFARKYDKNRHTLTHYKGTMICGFCPGSGSSLEKSFNRADVFKRHLTSVHAVEQTPPNSRKKTSGSLNSGKKLSGYAPDATGKCSTCSATFSNAQDFYEHLDDCVLRQVQQEEPSEAINAARLAEVEQDQDVHDTLVNNQLPTTTNVYSDEEEDEEEEEDDDDDHDFTLRSRSTRKGRVNRNPANGVQKSRGLTHSKGGVRLNSRGRKRRRDFPSSWGCPTPQMKVKKRVVCLFDGPRRLWKDDMMMNTDYEVRLKLANEKAYVTDLDVQTMRRADAFHNATEEEKGPWIADDLTGMDLEKLMEVKKEL